MSADPILDGPARSESTHQLTLKVEDEYLVATAAGSRTWPVVSSLVTEIVHAAIENKRSKLLVDVRQLEGWLGSLSSYSIVTQDFQRFRGKGIMKVAIVDRPLPKVREFFFQMVARNRGFNLRIFESSELALDWLLDHKTDSAKLNR